MERTQPTTAQQTRAVPALAEVYGIVVSDELSTPVIKVGLDALRRKDVDTVIFLCMAPHDIRTRTDWPAILAHLESLGSDVRHEVRIVGSPADLLEASLDIRVLRLPDDRMYSRW